MDLTADLAGDEQSFLDLESLASEPYTSFVYSSPDQAFRIRQYLFDRSLCEFSPPYGRLLRDHGRVAGMLAVLSGTELTRARLRAALALAKSGLLDEDPAMARRLHSAGQALLKLQPEDFYISRVAASDTARGRGIGTYLVRQAETEARVRGCPRIVLEVSPGSPAAVHLYQREGFHQIDARQVTDPNTSRSLEYLHLAKLLD